MESRLVGTDATPSGPGSDVNGLTWYGRLAVWVGAVVLLAQSVTGRGAGFMTVIAVACLCVGSATFLAGLARGEPPPRAAPIPVESPAVTSEAPQLERQEAAASGASGRTLDTASHPESVPAIDTASNGESPPAIDAAPLEQASPVPEPEDGSARVPSEERIRTVAVVPGTAEHGRSCPRCGQRVQAGQIAATCPVCHEVHHATCWTENLFSCSTPGCAGNASLEAPRRVADGPKGGEG